MSKPHKLILHKKGLHQTFVVPSPRKRWPTWICFERSWRQWERPPRRPSSERCAATGMGGGQHWLEYTFGTARWAPPTVRNWVMTACNWSLIATRCAPSSHKLGKANGGPHLVVVKTKSAPTRTAGGPTLYLQ